MQMKKWICYAVGYVFITSGISKLVVHDFKGMFANLGLPYPELILFLVAILELSCGLLIASRMYIKQATPPLILIMIVAIILTKVPNISSNGLLSFAFEARLDIVMLILLFLVWKHGETRGRLSRFIEK
ncbi:DoxX family protein [Oceanobacillus sp. FSL H7-0719]|uniref:DoxX family protein n=1 Tax=Oceanobacillus sp. FSL H7-0719 TaxID=2954507 RepID=UPI0032460970